MSHYRRIRRRHEPVDPARITSSERQCGFRLGGGYRDILQEHGLGVIADDISLVAPEDILSASESHKESFADDISMPNQLSENILRSSVMMATDSTRLSYWYHPDIDNGLLLYDGDEDRCLRCPFGFRDPRLAFSDSETGDVDFPELIFDSRLDCTAAQFTCAEPDVRIHELAKLAFQMWFAPGDLIVGGTSRGDSMTAYLSGIWGSITFQGHYELNRPNLISLSYDRSAENEVMVYANSLIRSGFARSIFS